MHIPIRELWQILCICLYEGRVYYIREDSARDLFEHTWDGWDDLDVWDVPLPLQTQSGGLCGITAPPQQNSLLLGQNGVCG